MIEIKQVTTHDDIERLKALMDEYTEWVRREVDKVEDLSTVPSFSDYEAEMQSLPGIFGPPDGRLLLASEDGETTGCVALKNLGNGTCELKRLYVRPAFRGKGIARMLVETLIRDARQMDYRTMVLDTHIDLKAAQKLYETLGFEVTSDGHYSLEDANMAAAVVFMRLALD